MHRIAKQTDVLSKSGTTQSVSFKISVLVGPAFS